MDERSVLLKQYRKFTGDDPVDIVRMPRSGSDRLYFRIIEKRRTIIGVYNPNRDENQTFIGFSRHFARLNLPVPEVLYYDKGSNAYFLQDLGDTNLFTWIERKRQTTGFDEEVVDIYRKTLDRLIEFQVRGIKDLNLDLCYPHRSFDRQSMMWDLNYFKYMFLKLIAVPFNEKRLEKDFNALADFLLEAGQHYFLYRDFQSANIMVLDKEPWFIDYQGGRLGAAQYDLASLLYDSKAHIPQQVREILIEHYIENFCEYTKVDEAQFRKQLPGFIIIRIMQALGAYGYRGLYEQKPGFVQSIIPAIRDLDGVIGSGSMAIDLPELFRIIEQIPSINRFEVLQEPEILRISISSFSYMNGIPSDRVHGGGFVFDCRCLANPGK
ncbi:MAG: phosphotransferase enzyme family protein, partial [Bacteroidia bacterium]